MDDLSGMILAAGETAKNADPKILEMVYQDMARKSVQNIGQAIGDLFGLLPLITMPIRGYNEKHEMRFKKNMDEYAREIEGIPDDKRVPAQPEIGVPILQKLDHTDNQEIADVYLSLLANAANADLVKGVHPRFVNIISGLSSDEAKILETFKVGSPGTMLAMMPSEIGTINIVDRINDSGPSQNPWANSGTVSKFEDKFTMFEVSDVLQFPSNSKMYFDNMVSLSIVQHVPRRATFVDYNPLIEARRERLEMIRNMDGRVHDLGIEFGVYSLTNFGIAFIRACRSKDNT